MEINFLYAVYTKVFVCVGLTVCLSVYSSGAGVSPAVPHHGGQPQAGEPVHHRGILLHTHVHRLQPSSHRQVPRHVARQAGFQVYDTDHFVRDPNLQILLTTELYSRIIDIVHIN